MREITLSQSDVAWQNQRACKGKNLKVFFPDSGEGDEQAQKAVCNTCVVKRPCLEYALVNNTDDEGVWGGLNQQERRALQGS